MSETVGTIAYRSLRAPREDGGVFIDPPVADEAALLRQNIALRDQQDCDVHGCSLRQLRDLARRGLLQRATAYTREYRDVSMGDLNHNSPLILTGHQPDLTHPGVWFKNFLLSELAHRTSSYAVHLLIDNDSVRTTSIPVPSGSSQNPFLTSVALDASTTPVPYEARTIKDPALFSTFASRVQETIAPLIGQPLVSRFWPGAVDAAGQHSNLGRALAQARHMLEGAWGLHSLELPLSAVCDDRSFRWFAAHLLNDAPRLRDIHNACVAEYRRVSKVRSHTHPVPDLVQDDPWTEVPFWLWTVEQPRRRAAFVRRQAQQVTLSDRKDVCITLDLGPDADASRCVDQLDEAHRRGVRLRPRALITTMYARLVLSDLFIHGIGGAKYDQVTDAIVRRFFAVEPLEYILATATLKLPVPRTRVAPEDIQRVKLLLRELRFHPELHVDATPEALPLIAEKRRWIESKLPANRLRERHQGISSANAALHAMLGPRRGQLLAEEVELRSLLRKQAILDSREYAFCLFPVESIRNRLLDLSRQ